MPAVAIPLGNQLLGSSSGLPGSCREPDQFAGPNESDPFSLFSLAPGGVYLARLVTQPAGELLPHRFTLTLKNEFPKAVYFLLHFP